VFRKEGTRVASLKILRVWRLLDEENQGHVGGKCSKLGQMRRVDLASAQHLLKILFRYCSTIGKPMRLFRTKRASLDSV
jgi:hypothetical protein